MKSTLPAQMGADRTAMMQARVRSITQVRAHGTQKIPAMPRGIIAQPAPGGAVLTWHLPTRYDDVTGYRIYTGTEKNLTMQLRDRGTRQIFVPLTQGGTAESPAPPPLNNIFVSVVNGFREGPRQQIQVAASDESTGDPQLTMPTPTPDFLNQFSGGLDKTQSGQPSGKKTP
jgi:hypothetical protein